LTLNGSISAFAFSLSGAFVVYLADQEVYARLELFQALLP
jgi:hypothetical protein